MSNSSIEDASSLSPLNYTSIVYRLARSRSWVDEDNKAFVPRAFYRRENEPGISVSIADAVTLEFAISGAGVLNKCYGVASLQVGPIRDINLDVIPDTVDHANIIGMPLVSEDKARADYYADLLAEQSHLLWPN